MIFFLELVVICEFYRDKEYNVVFGIGSVLRRGLCDWEVGMELIGMGGMGNF